MHIRDYAHEPAMKLELATFRELTEARTMPEILAAFFRHRAKVTGFTHRALFMPLPGGQYKLLLAGAIDDEAPSQNQLVLESLDQLQDLPVHQGGLLGRLSLAPAPATLSGLMLEPGGLFPPGLNAGLMVPIFDANLPEFRLVLLRRGDEPTPQELHTALLSANMLSRLLDAARLRQGLVVAHARLDAQLEEVRRVQHSILPAQHPDAPGLRFASAYEPCQAAGGDYYDYNTLPDGRVGVVVADVSGHGPGAAVVMAQVRTATRHSATTRGGEGIALDINRMLARILSPGTFVTALFVLVDPRDGSILLRNCGHPPARIIRRRGEVEPVGLETCLPLGVCDEISPLEGMGIARLDPGDCLVLYTDGITEAMCPQRKLFGDHRLDAALADGPNDPDAIIRRLLRHVAEHRAGAEPNDDVCVVAVGRV